jgi:hypothetical protein
MFSNAEICDFDIKPQSKLEPRLIEYLKKKKYYKENNIETHLIEKEFNIDKNDIIKIRHYLNGKKSKQDTEHSDMVKPEAGMFESERLNLGNDKRLQKVVAKQQRHNDAIKQKNNSDVMSRGYDMYRDDRKFASAYGDDFKSRFNPQVWLEDSRKPIPHDANKRNIGNNNFDSGNVSDGSDFEDSNPNDANPNANQIVDMRQRYTNPNIYKNKPAKIRFKDYMTRGCNEDLATQNYSLDSIIGNLDTYTENLSKFQKKNEMDLDMKVSIPGSGCSNKRDKENNYRAVPYMNGSKKKDVDIENYLCYGNGPSRGAKSLGYPNPAEHYFQYISDDISKPEHTVFEPGMPTRMNNKDTARRYKGRDVLP